MVAACHLVPVNWGRGRNSTYEPIDGMRPIW